MKLTNTAFNIETEGTTEQGDFGIKDMGFVLELLRNKIYSNIPLAVCREYVCNARDAHREAGKPERPIEITLPTMLEPTYKVRDFGKSISPENMVDIFIQYGASTKRTTNKLTGGFGIGCKVFFGYTDSFTINTFIDGTKRSYQAVIDETKCGKLHLMAVTPSSEENGLEIVGTIKNKDHEQFGRWTNLVCKHWDVKPIIKNAVEANFQWQVKNDIVLEGTNWTAVKTNRYAHRDPEIVLIVDGIEYEFDLASLENYKKLMPGVSGDIKIFLTFKTGQISLSANREQIELNDRSKTSITKQLKVIAKEIEDKFSETLALAPTYLEANLKLHEIKNSILTHSDKVFTWNAIPLHGQLVVLDRGRVKWFARESGEGKELKLRISKTEDNKLLFSKDAVYCVTKNPFDNTTHLGAKAIFNAKPDIKILYIAYFPDESEIKNLHLDNLDLLKFEDFYSKKSRKQTLGRLTFCKWSRNRCSFRRSSLKEFEEDQNKKIWCKIKKSEINGYPTKIIGLAHNVTETEIESFINLNCSEYSLYAFPENIPVEKLEDATAEMTPLNEFINKFVKDKNINIDHVAFVKDYDLRENLIFPKPLYLSILESKDNFKEDSTFLKYLNKAEVFKTKYDELKNYTFLLDLMPSTASKFDVELTDMVGNLMSEYPMLKYFTYKRLSYCYEVDLKISSKDLIDYINLCDLKKIA
jgi:hypothetical protein